MLEYDRFNCWQPLTHCYTTILLNKDHVRNRAILVAPLVCVKANNKQLLDEVFVISGIIKVEVSVISRSRRLRLTTLTETLIIPDITKTESNNCFIIHCFEENNDKRIIAAIPVYFQTLNRLFTNL